MPNTDTARAIAAAPLLLGRRIDLGRAPYDFTPRGKRSARRVALRSAMGRVYRLRWYVGGRIYHQLPMTPATIHLTRQWIANAGAADNRPQSWESIR